MSRVARPGGGQILVRLHDDAEGVRLTVEDDGEAEDTLMSEESLELVRGMAEHLGGTVEVTANGRRTVTVRLAPDRPVIGRH